MKRLLVLVTFFVCVWIVLLATNPLPVPQTIKGLEQGNSLRILDRNGHLLRETLSTQGGRRLSVSLRDVAPSFTRLLVTTEDQRFRYHCGVDPISLARALLQNVRSGHVVSGGSTLTMQTVRLALPGKRTLTKKVSEIFLALYLEMSLSKDEILSLYINNMPLGLALYGIAPTSRAYFKKSPKDLSLAESAYLIGIVRAPSRYHPYKNPKAVLLLKNKILAHYAQVFPQEDERVARSIQETIVVYPSEHRFLAPHFTDFIIKQAGQRQGRITTTLDVALNEKIETIVDEQLSLLKDRQVTAASVLVVSNQTGEILGYVGSANYWDQQTLGMNDGVQQFRQPGSALKPFTYAKALDVGFLPTHLLADVPTTYPSPIGDYIPENYDRKFRGPVLMREALANSLNVPAVQLVNEMGVEALYQTLKDARFSRLTEDPAHYGLGLTLGNVEVSLFELVRGYLTFVHQGRFKNLNYEMAKDAQETTPTKLFSPKAASIIRDFLSDPNARATAFGSDGPLNFDYPVMIKTGTSQGYRDNWTVAVTPAYTVGVWAGNFNNEPMQDVSGVAGAAPIAHALVDYLYQKHPWTSWKEPPQQKKMRVCSLSGKKPTKHCARTRWEFVDDEEKISACDFHLAEHTLKLPEKFIAWQLNTVPETLPSVADQISPGSNTGALKIISPQEGAVYRIDTQRPRESQYLSLKTTPTSQPYTILLDGEKLTHDEARHIDLVPGEHHLSLVLSPTLKSERRVLGEVRYRIR